MRRHVFQTKVPCETKSRFQAFRRCKACAPTVDALNFIYQSNGWNCSYRFEFEASIESLLTLQSSSF